MVRRRRNGHEWVQVGNGRDLRRLAYGLEQELADFAIVRVVRTAACSYELSRNRTVLVIVRRDDGSTYRHRSGRAPCN